MESSDVPWKLSDVLLFTHFASGRAPAGSCSFEQLERALTERPSTLDFVRVVYDKNNEVSKNGWTVDGRYCGVGNTEHFAMATNSESGLVIRCPCIVGDGTSEIFAYCVTIQGGNSRHRLVRGEQVEHAETEGGGCFFLYFVLFCFAVHSWWGANQSHDETGRRPIHQTMRSNDVSTFDGMARRAQFVRDDRGIGHANHADDGKPMARDLDVAHGDDGAPVASAAAAAESTDRTKNLMFYFCRCIEKKKTGGVGGVCVCVWGGVCVFSHQRNPMADAQDKLIAQDTLWCTLFRVNDNHYQAAYVK